MVFRQSLVLQSLNSHPLSAVNVDTMEEGYTCDCHIANNNCPKNDDITTLSETAAKAILVTQTVWLDFITIISLLHQKSEVLESARGHPHNDYLLQLSVDTKVVSYPSDFKAHVDESYQEGPVHHEEHRHTHNLKKAKGVHMVDSLEALEPAFVLVIVKIA